MDGRGLGWFRLYADWLHHPKVQRLSEADQRRYVGILCLACSGRLDTADIGALAFELRIGEDDAAQTVERLIAAGLLTEAGEVHNWHDRQPRRDCSAERTRRWRERSGDGHGDRHDEDGDGHGDNRTRDAGASAGVDDEMRGGSTSRRKSRAGGVSTSNRTVDNSVTRHSDGGDGHGDTLEERRGEEIRGERGVSSSSSTQKKHLVARVVCDDAVRLTEKLRELILKNDPLAKVPVRESETWQRWMQDLERIQKLDGRSWSDIEAAIEYTQADAFWRSNVLSPGKLRKQFATVLLRMQANGRTGSAPAPTVTREMVATIENAIADGDDLEEWIQRQPVSLAAKLREIARWKSKPSAFHEEQSEASA